MRGDECGGLERWQEHVGHAVVGGLEAKILFSTVRLSVQYSRVCTLRRVSGRDRGTVVQY